MYFVDNENIVPLFPIGGQGVSYKTGDILKCVSFGNEYAGEVVISPKDLTVRLLDCRYNACNTIHLPYMAPFAYTKELTKDSSTNEYGTLRLYELFLNLVKDYIRLQECLADIVGRREEYLKSMDEFQIKIVRVKDRRRVAKKALKDGVISSKEYVAVCNEVKRDVLELERCSQKEFYRLFGDLMSGFTGISNIYTVISEICNNTEEMSICIKI